MSPACIMVNLPELAAIFGSLIGFCVIVTFCSRWVAAAQWKRAFARMDELDARMAADEEYLEPMNRLALGRRATLPGIAQRLADSDGPSRRRYLQLIKSVHPANLDLVRDELVAIARNATDPLAPEVWAHLAGAPAAKWGKAYAASDGGQDESVFLRGIRSTAVESWTGWYRYPLLANDGGDHVMTLELTLLDGRVEGRGTDDIGPFTFAGTCDSTTVDMVKTYSSHTVDYHGHFRSGAIEGRWSIGPHWSGEFRLWRADSAAEA